METDTIRFLVGADGKATTDALPRIPAALHSQRDRWPHGKFPAANAVATGRSWVLRDHLANEGLQCQEMASHVDVW
jgi:hypothetical protein